MVDSSQRRFPRPWSVAGNAACYWIEDSEGKALCFIYFKDDVLRHAGEAVKLTRDEARRIARGIARLPELLGR
jgi:hypothetical protein